MPRTARRIRARITPGGSISATISQGGSIGASLDKARAPIYHGAYTVTPTRTRQVLETHGTDLVSDIVVEPIPSNYGLITWNGSTLTVS